MLGSAQNRADKAKKKKKKSLIQLLHPEVLAHSWDTKLIINTGSILVIPSSAEQSQQEQAQIVLGGHRQPTQGTGGWRHCTK